MMTPTKKQLDHLEWVAGISFVSYGLRIGIRVNERAVLDHLLERLPPGWKPTSLAPVERLYSVIAGGPSAGARGRRLNVLYAGTERLARTRELDYLLDALESDLHLYVAEMAHQRLFVHAGVVGWGEQAIVIPGRSFSGKSTLVAALVRAGATYYSDEFAVLDGQGLVYPYPRPLALRGEAGGKPGRLAADALGGRCGDQPVPVGLIAITKYRVGARWQPRPLSPGEAALVLLANTVSIRRQPGIALAKLKEVAAKARALKGMRGEAEETVGPLIQALALEPAALSP
jgi:hypothetical protein